MSHLYLHYLIVDPLFIISKKEWNMLLERKKEGKARKFDEPYLGSKVQQNYLTIDHFSVFNASCLVWLISQIWWVSQSIRNVRLLAWKRVAVGRYDIVCRENQSAIRIAVSVCISTTNSPAGAYSACNKEGGTLLISQWKGGGGGRRPQFYVKISLNSIVMYVFVRGMYECDRA